MLTGDPCDPIFQVRLVIGDTDMELVSDEVIDFALTNHAQDIRKASIEVLKYIVAYVANQMSHSVGDVWIDNKKLYDQLSDLLDSIVTDPTYITGMLSIIVGGTSKTKKDSLVADSDVVGSPISVGFYTGDG